MAASITRALVLAAASVGVRAVCTDPYTGTHLEPLDDACADGCPVTWRGAQPGTWFGDMLVRPCSAIATGSAAATTCSFHGNQSTPLVWTACGTEHKFLEHSQYEDREGRSAILLSSPPGATPAPSPPTCTLYPPTNMATTITFRCNPSATGTGIIEMYEMPPGIGPEWAPGFVHSTCFLNLTWSTNLVCDAPLPPPPSPGPAAGEGGMSGGWAFILTVTIGMGLYCGLGAFYNHRKYMLPFPDNVPQNEFWKDLPGLVLDGIEFAKCGFNKAAVGSLQRGGDYDAVDEGKNEQSFEHQ